MVSESKSSNRNLFIILSVVAVVLIVAAGAVIAAVVLGGDDSSEGASIADSAKLMPNDTLGYFAFNPHLDQVKNFEAIEKIWGDNPLLTKGLAEMLGSMQEEGLDYEADIQSWLGDEVAVAMGAGALASMSGDLDTSFEQLGDALTGGSVEAPMDQMKDVPVPEFIIVAATKDTSASDSFLDKLKAEAEKEGNAWQETVYNGVEILFLEPESEGESGVAFATVDNYVVLAAGGPESIQAVIDAKDGSHLAENQNFQDVMAKLPAEQAGYGYMDLSAYVDSMLQAMGPALAEMPVDLFNPEQLDALKGAGFSFGFEPNGLRVDFVSVYDQDAVPESPMMAQAIANIAAERVPADALFYVSGSGLGGMVQTMVDAIKAMPDQPEDLDEQLQLLTAMLGVSFDELIEMLSGEFALAVLSDPAGLGGDPSMPIGVSFLLEAKDEAKFQSLLNSVSGLLKLSGEMDLTEGTVAGVEVMMIPGFTSSDPIAGLGVGNGFFAIATNEDLLEAAFGGDIAKLSQDPTYEAVLAQLPKEVSGILFLNMEEIMGIATQAMGPSDLDSFEEAQSLLGPIKAVGAGMESISSDRDSASGTLFILVESD